MAVVVDRSQGFGEIAGFEVLLPQSQACCGLTLISTGQLDGARARLTNTREVLAP